MFQSILLISIVLVGVVFTRMNHPLAMGLMLLIQTLFISLMTGVMASSFWFSYVLFLVFLGGMLVLFLYVTSLASNEMFSISFSTLVVVGVVMMSGLMISYVSDLILEWSYFSSDQNILCSGINMIGEESAIVSKIYLPPTIFLTLLLVVYLFLTLVVVVFLTDSPQGPLRLMY